MTLSVRFGETYKIQYVDAKTKQTVRDEISHECRQAVSEHLKQQGIESRVVLSPDAPEADCLVTNEKEKTLLLWNEAHDQASRQYADDLPDGARGNTLSFGQAVNRARRLSELLTEKGISFVNASEIQVQVQTEQRVTSVLKPFK